VSAVVRAPRSEFDSSQNIFNSIQFNFFSKTTIHGARRADERDVTRAVARRPAFAPAEEIRASRRERAKRARTSEYTEDVRELNESKKSKKKYESKKESKFSRNITTNPRRRRPASSPSASPLEPASLKLGLETRVRN